MKNIYKTLVLALFTSLLYTSCDLEENPPFLAPDNVYTTVAGADVALNGIFNSLADNDYYSTNFHHVALYMSGVFTPKKQIDRETIGKLSPFTSQNYPNNLWRKMYQTIARTNDMLANVDNSTGDFDYILGITYFIRAHTYFNLLKIYGGVPLYTTPATEETLSLPRASVDEVYALIIADAKKAKAMMLDASAQSNTGRPGKYAANMLLAKVYMSLASDDNTSPNWQNAYNEAIEVYGKYTLVANYGDLWASQDLANNNAESIFEIQHNVENPSKLTRLFTPNNAYPGRGWERFRANPETIDMHMAKYPNDPRIDITFISEYRKNGTGNAIKVYPTDDRRKSVNKAYPYIYKYFVKDQTANTDLNNYNYVRYRYADLLLMLAEIENELGMTGAAHQHVNEVLTRARNTGGGTVEPADWTGLSQVDFRAAIMREYQYELLGEGEDFFVSRRRGYNFFKTNYIDVHNNFTPWKSFDIEYPDNSKAMLLPIPNSEIETNDQISPADQNPGY